MQASSNEQFEAPGIEGFLEAWGRGWSVIPLRAREKKSLIRWKAYQTERADRNTVLSWLGQWPDANLGIVTGAISGLVVLDVDGVEGMISLSILGIVPRTPNVQTGKGRQYYFRHPGPDHHIRNFTAQLPGLDLRGDGGYVVGAGSVHPNGQVYRWVVSPDEAPPAEIPQWLLKLIESGEGEIATTASQLQAQAYGEDLSQDFTTAASEKAQEGVQASAGVKRLTGRMTSAQDGVGFARAALRGEVEKVAAAPDGTKHDRLLRSAIALGGLAPPLTEQEIEEALYAAVEGRADDKQEARNTIRDGIKYGMDRPREIPPGKEPAHLIGVENGIKDALVAEAEGEGETGGVATSPSPSREAGQASSGLTVIRGRGAEQPARTFNLTDMGNAERLVDRYGEEIRYCAGWKRWLMWDSRRWAFDETGRIGDLAKQTIRQMYIEVAQCDDESRRKALAKHAHQSESNSRVMGMLGRAQDEQSVAVMANQLDRSPWLFNCANGTLDLRTGELRDHSQGDYITKQSLVGYDPTAECPTWLGFLDKIMGGKSVLIGFLQRAAGYSLTGSTQERALFLLFGSGANGKSTFLETLRAVMGDYAVRTPTETLMQKRDGAVRDDVARLKGARFVSASETDEGKRLAESLIKDLTGGDVMTARFLYSHLFEFKPECKIWLSTNHKPVIRGTDKGIWDRIKLVPFEVRIPNEEQDKNLPQKLQAELPGILAWMVRGCLDWQQRGLGTTPEVEAATESYRVEMDVLGPFIEERCVVKTGARVTAKELYVAYLNWCEENGEKPISKTAVGLRLQERGFQALKSTGGSRLWIGIDIPTEIVGHSGE